MLEALEAFERSPWADELGWEVLINPDEEIGSPGSKLLLEEAARTNDIGLIFEPSLSDGNLVGPRRGSGNFMITVKGRAAHAGREPDIGRNAINALADFIVQLNSLPPGAVGLTLNVGYIEGGGPVNVVPDTAICRFNVRVSNSEDQQLFEDHLELVKARINQIDGISIESRGEFSRPPKPLDNRNSKTSWSFCRGRSRTWFIIGIAIQWGSLRRKQLGRLGASHGRQFGSYRKRYP